MTDNVEYGPEIAVDGMPDWLGEDEKVIGRWGEDTWYSGGPTWKKCYASSGVITAIRLPADHWAYKAIDAGFIPWGGGDAAPEGVTDVLFRVGSPCATSGTDLRWTHIGSEGDIIGYRKVDAVVNHAYESRMADRHIEPEPIPAFKAGDYVVALDDSQDIVAGNVYVMIDIAHFTDEAGDERPIAVRPVRSATPEEIAAYKRANQDTPVTDTVTIPKMTEAEAVALWNTYLDRDTTAREDIIDMLRSLGLIKSEPTLVEKFEDHYGSLDHNQRAILEFYQEWVAGQ